MKLSRRSFFAGLGATVAAVAIVPKAFLKFIPEPPVVELFPGWLECNGAVISAEKYPTLFAVLGKAYGDAPKGKFKLPTFPAPDKKSVVVSTTPVKRHKDLPPFIAMTYAIHTGGNKSDLVPGYILPWINSKHEDVV
jgi:Phage Tail Collar Domain